MISKRTIDQIFETAEIEDVVSEFVLLKKRGANRIGLCPFHNEKTPSFTVSPAKGLYKCFGCGKAGNSVGFIMEHEKFSYPEALRFLAQKYNIQIEETKTDYDKEQQNEIDSLYIVNEFAKQFFINQLWETEEGRNIGLSYFKERGYNEATIKKFELGFTTKNWDGLIKAAEEKGYKREYLERLGLIKVRTDKSFDFFRDRVMFTISNVSGKPLAFAGRTLLSDKKIPKYINSPETEIYNKSKVLYGIFYAKNEIRRQNNCFLVEGYTDVISLHQAGVENVVASSGTALTEDQVRLIKRYTKNITVLYDGDAAGIKAATRGVEIILQQDMNVQVVLLPENEDPDSFIKSVGQSGFEDYVQDRARDFILFQMDLLEEDASDDPLKKADMVKAIVKTLSNIQDPIKRSLYIQTASERLALSERIIIQETNKIKRQQYKRKSEIRQDEVELIEQQAGVEYVDAAKQTENLYSDRSELLEKEIVTLLIEFGDKNYELNQKLGDFILNASKEFRIKQTIYAKMVEEYREARNRGEEVDSDYFIQHSNIELAKAAADLLSRPYALSDNWQNIYGIFVTLPAENFKSEVENLLDSYLFKQYQQLLKENQDRIKEFQLKGLEKDEDFEQVQIYQAVDKQLKEKMQEIAEKWGIVIY